MAAHPLIFAQTSWFWALPVIILIGVGLWYLSRFHTYRRVARFFSVKTGAGVLKAIDWKNKRLHFIVTAAILVLFALALTRPLTGPKSDQGERKGGDLVILLDVSKSMWVEDVEPNRMEAAKNSLNDWIQKQRSDRIGLILFAGEAFVQAPLTYDYNALGFVLKDAGPGSVSAKGSNLPKAIETATEMLNNNEVESKILLIVSDGEVEGDAITAARTAHQQHGITIFTVGIGTTAGGKVISFDKKKTDKPAPNSPYYVRNEFGGEVISRLESQSLRAIAGVAGGKYYEWKAGEPTFEILREKSLMPLVEKKRKIDTKDYDEWFQIPLGLALLLLLLEPLIAMKRKPSAKPGKGVAVIQPVTHSRRPQIRPRKNSAPAAATLLSLLILLAACSSAHAVVNSYMEKTEALLKEGKKEEAALYMRELAEKNPTDAYLIYNLGLTLMRADKPDQALPIFESVMVLSQDEKLRAKSAFQMGTINLETAIRLKKEKQPGVTRVRALENALSYYELQNEIHSTKESRHNTKLTEQDLEEVLLDIGKERTRANTLKTLREALQAYERAAELNEKHQPLVDQSKDLLARKLAEEADKIDKEADQREAGVFPEGKTGDNALAKTLEKRQEALNTLQEASGLAPEDKAIAEAIKKQQEKMSDLLTRMAKRNAEPVLKEDKIFFSSGNFRSLEEASGQLNQALTLNPENKEAREFSEKVKNGRVDAHTANGDLALKHLRKGSEEEKKLSNAQAVQKEFTAVLGLDPENKKAKEALAEVEPMLAELYAAVGNQDLEKAKEQLGVEGAAPEAPPSAPGEAPGAPEGTETAAGDPSASDPSASASSPSPGSTPGASEKDLRNASATLEKSLSNLTAAVSIKPQDAKHQQSLNEAEKLMGSVRDQLAKLEAAKGDAGGAAGEGEGKAEGEAQGGPGGDPKSGPGGTMMSMSGLRGKPGAGGAGGGDSQRYWEKYARDW